jgi:predicted ATPase/DNA-binding CsgD family transcriptional regulator
MPEARGLPLGRAGPAASAASASRFPSTRHARRLRLSRAQHNLPSQLTSFIGREREIAQLRTLLADTRLLTLTGAGGIGKTRLALEAAALLLPEYPDGVWLVELAPLPDPALLPQAVALSAGVRQEFSRPVLESLASALQDSCVLLVLDNCEHMVAACAALADALLRACPRLRILATSRESLGVPGETAWPVPALTLPSARATAPVGAAAQPALTELAASEAVRLLVNRAGAVSPGFHLSAQNAPAVADVCRRLDGLPLAIELAAARVKALGIQEIAARLDDRLRLLAHGGRTAPPRHQSLRAAIEWSYEQLDASERLVFDRLSVFAGGWTLEAAEAVCGAAPEEADPALDASALDLLSRLVEKSLVLAELEPDGAVRYRLLETLRQFGQEHLRARGGTELEATRRRHAAFFLGLVERAGPELDGSAQGVWLDRLEAERDNLRAVFDRAIELGEQGAALRLGANLWRFWERHGHFSEGRLWLERALAMAGAAPDALRATALHGAGHLAWRQRDLERAACLHQESLSLSRAGVDSDGVARSLYGLARVAASRGDYAAAISSAEESLAIRRTLGNRNDIAITLNVLGEIARYRRDYARAGALYQESLALFRETGDKLGIQIELHNLGYVLKQQGELRRAADVFAESLELSRELGIRMGMASCIGGLAGVATGEGRPERAARLFGAAEALREAIAFPMEVVDRAELDRDVAAVEAALGEAALRAAWSEGRAMPLEQAVEEALAGGARRSRIEPGRRDDAEAADALTPREREVAALVAQGLTNRQIAEALVIAKQTADRHVSNILAKLGFASRAQVGAWLVAQER